MIISDTNIQLAKVLGPSWQRIRCATDDDGRQLHMAHDICEKLGISNVTQAIKGVRGQDRVSLVNRQKQYIRDWNPRRAIYLLTLPGVFQVILNNSRNARCKVIRNYIGCNYLPNVPDLVLHDHRRGD